MPGAADQQAIVREAGGASKSLGVTADNGGAAVFLVGCAGWVGCSFAPRWRPSSSFACRARRLVSEPDALVVRAVSRTTVIVPSDGAAATATEFGTVPVNGSSTADRAPSVQAA